MEKYIKGTIEILTKISNHSTNKAISKISFFTGTCAIIG